MADEYQKELFDDFGREKSKIKKISDKITERRRRLHVTLGVENIVFAVIIVMMCMVVVFALGTEHGKHLGSQSLLSPRPIVYTRVPENNPADIVEAEAPKTEEAPKPSRYVIQLISYKAMEPAIEEKNKLLNKNVHAVIITAGEWYQVCVGGYDNIKDAKRALVEFSKDYNGCFVRNTGR